MNVLAITCKCHIYTLIVTFLSKYMYVTVRSHDTEISFKLNHNKYHVHRPTKGI